MSGRMRVTIIAATLLVAVVVCLITLCLHLNRAQSEKRVRAFVNAVNYDFKTPERFIRT